MILKFLKNLVLNVWSYIQVIFVICLIKKKKLNKSYFRLKNSANYAKKLGLEVHAGHGLTYKSAMAVSRIDQIVEFNIGHSLIAESLFIGLKNTIRKFKKVINK